jgi:hypothetical protein
LKTLNFALGQNYLDNCGDINYNMPQNVQKLLFKQEERVKLLERELHIQKRSLGHNKEKLNLYKKEFSNLKANIKIKEYENSNLVEKLAELTV